MSRWHWSLSASARPWVKRARRASASVWENGAGAWDEMEVSVNTLVEDLLRPTTEVTRAIAAVAQGNLTQTVRLDVDGRRWKASSCVPQTS